MRRPFLFRVVVLSWLVTISPPNLTQAAQGTGNCRFGITVVDSAANYDLSALGVGGYLDWGLMPPPNGPNALDYIHMVRLRNPDRQFVYDPALPEVQSGFEATLRTAVQHSRGAAWLVGNEPDTTFENQDSVSADQYALAYRNIYHLIKSSDSAAQVGIGTIVQPTPLRLQWLDQVWGAYAARYQTMPPSDFWSIHSFILRENLNDWGTGIPPGVAATAGELYTLEQTDDVEIFKSRLFDFRRWLADHGQRQKPLWITEYGSLLPHDGQTGFVTQPIEQARDYMLATFDILLSIRDPEIGYGLDGDRLVQRWFWYSLDDDLWRFGGSLFDPETKQRTLIGDAFAGYVAPLPMRPELHLSAPIVRAWARGSEGVMLAEVTVSNWGTASTTQPYRVSWYVGEPGSDESLLAGPTAVTLPLPGCGSFRKMVARLESALVSQQPLFVRLETGDLPTPIVVSISHWPAELGPRR